MSAPRHVEGTESSAATDPVEEIGAEYRALTPEQELLLVAEINALRAQKPLVQCLTNNVVSQITANALLAAGAEPVMCDTPYESFDFARIADGVLVNAGTPTDEQYSGMRQAIAGAAEAQTPWVLDPVEAGGLAARTHFYRQAVHLAPTIIRGNATEIAVLAKVRDGYEEVDSSQTLSVTVPAAKWLSEYGQAIVAASGLTDVVVSPAGTTLITGGHPLLNKVIGTGCFLGALCAAYAGAARKEGLDPHWAIVAAHAHTAAAGAKAGAQFPAQPGSFHVAWIDALYSLTPREILDSVTIAHSDSGAQATT